jgi:anti-sigma factor RsiW
MSHLGQRLSALMDGELDNSERERVLIHLSKCTSCRDEVAALRMLKRRMNAIGEAAADEELTGRLMSLRDAATGPGHAEWPESATAGGWLTSWHGKAESRVGWYVLGGSVAAVLAGLGTAAFIVGGPQDHAPEPSITPSVDVYITQHYLDTGLAPAGQGLVSRGSATGLAGARSGGGAAGAVATQPGGQGVTARDFRGLQVPPRSFTASSQP